MTSDDEKDPPVPADLVGAPKRIHHDDAPKHGRAGREALSGEPDDGD